MPSPLLGMTSLHANSRFARLHHSRQRPFLPTLAHALLDGELIEGFPRLGRPSGARERNGLRADAARRGGARRGAAGGERRTTLLLPRIAPLGAFEPSEACGVAGDPASKSSPSPEIPPAVGELTRRMTLARLTRAWGQALRGAIRGVDVDGNLHFDESEPALVAASPAQAFALAADLAALIDDMIIEGVAWSGSKASRRRL